MSWFGSDEEDNTPKKPEPWEFLEDGQDFNTFRRKVPGGWIVRTQEPEYHGGGEALVFVPDPDYTWKI